MNSDQKRVYVTKHARERMAERLFVADKREAEDLATKARYLGITPGMLLRTDPKLARAMFRRIDKGKRRAVVRIYRNIVFIYKGSRGKRMSLITVLPLHSPDVPYS